MITMMTGNIKAELEQYQVRKNLLDRLSAEKQSIMTAIEKFYSQQARNESGALQALEEMIAAFDRVINAGDWESSLFLRNTVKPLKNMREEAVQLRDQLSGVAAIKVIEAPALAPGMIRVYIAIFQHKAHTLPDWEQQLKNLPQYILGRPIYREEAAVQQAIRAKFVQTSDAYVCVGIPEAAIQTGEYHPLYTDKQGNPLVQLVAGSVQTQNILEFVYQNKHYYFINGQLTLKA